MINKKAVIIVFYVKHIHIPFEIREKQLLLIRQMIDSQVQ